MEKPIALSIIGLNAGIKSFWVAGDVRAVKYMKKAAKKRFDGFSEFVDDEGKKWIQTSTEDLFSIRELNEIIDAIEKKDDGR